MSTTYTINAGALIRKALLKQGYQDFTATVDPTKQADMLDSLNIMIKAWSSKGIKLWCIQNITIPLVAGKAKYTIGPTGADVTANRPLRIEAAPTMSNIQTGNTFELMQLARYDYLTIGNPTSQGQPSDYFFNALIPNSEFYLYVTPDAATASNFVALIPQRRYISDINSITDSFDFPSEWYQALLWGLASETAEDNQIPASVSARIERRAEMYIQQMEDWDREWAPVSFAPDRRGSGYGSPPGRP